MVSPISSLSSSTSLAVAESVGPSHAGSMDVASFHPAPSNRCLWGWVGASSVVGSAVPGTMLSTPTTSSHQCFGTTGTFHVSPGVSIHTECLHCSCMDNQEIVGVSLIRGPLDRRSSYQFQRLSLISCTTVNFALQCSQLCLTVQYLFDQQNTWLDALS